MHQVIIIVSHSDNIDGNYAIYKEFPKFDVCKFMKTIYKFYFYNEIIKYSNLPHYDKCPYNKV